MQRNYELYQDLIANPSKYPNIFDMVVITAINSAQKACYEHQLEIKLARNRLPKSIPFRVISDPDGHKLGSGGSTLHVLATLNLESVDLSRMRVLLLHAGGYSQRAPSCSVLGKLFSSIACEHPAIEDMLDLKLANYMPFALNENMQPGVFLACSDEFESFDYDEEFSIGGRFGSDGNEIVLIAHKSALNIAKDHGVYVLETTNKEINEMKGVFKCRMVLQKPSIEMMRNFGIILKDSQSGDEYVYTDSVFYFTHSITRDLLEFHARHFQAILDDEIEIDAYRDFLQPLGSQPLSLDRFLASQPAKAHQTLTDIYKLFNGRATLIAALNDSEFFHLGTVNELLDLYLNQESQLSGKFRQSLGFTRLKNCTNFNVKTNCCVMNSKLGECTLISHGSILEYCLVDESTRLNVGSNCFISNCWAKSDLSLNVPDNVCLHTIAIKIGDDLKYSTVFFDRRDDLKKTYSELSELKFLGKILPKKIIEYLGSNEERRMNSIWELSIFQAYSTMSESFEKSIEFVNVYLSNEDFELSSDLEFYSLFDLLKYRCYEKMISFRKDNQLI